MSRVYPEVVAEVVCYLKDRPRSLWDFKQAEREKGPKSNEEGFRCLKQSHREVGQMYI